MIDMTAINQTIKNYRDLKMILKGMGFAEIREEMDEKQVVSSLWISTCSLLKITNEGDNMKLEFIDEFDGIKIS
jgi:hypothetical protein